MPRVLYVLGAAFGLPSIDAECTAAITVLSLRFGNDQKEWSIKSTHASPSTLPLLIDGDQSISGLSSICAHLQDGRLSRQLDADAVATTALIQARAPVLIAAYLYLSYENYSTTTRPAFTPILPLYARFLIPGALRSAAKESTKQLGIASLDIEALDDRHGSSEQKLGGAESTFETSSKERASLLLPKVKTVRSLLAQKPESMAVFKLQNLADAFLEPLQDLLGQQEFLSGESEPTEVDCLAYAYLALMLKPDVPQPWLSKIIHQRYSSLATYVKRFEMHLSLGSAAQVNATLPWTAPADASMQGVLNDLASVLAEHTGTTRSTAVGSAKDMRLSFWSRHLPAILLTAGSVLVAGASWALLPILTSARGDPIQIFGGRQDLSHLSNALAGLSFSLPRHDSQPHIETDNEAPARVGIEIES